MPGTFLGMFEKPVPGTISWHHKLSGTASGTLADSTKNEYKMADPLEVYWKDRHVTLDALVIPDAESILLGAIPLEAMDLTINPRRELVEAHGDQTMHFI